ncbi:MAG: TetR/AcrR family transcriptional regulator [Clostridiales bacterium]|nr:TetR/AcrR family transcriptional regulator [Clostridiales bacterium]
MEEKGTDRRVRRTKARLRQAMTQLMLEKDLSSITVRELTDLADVNRGTFYTHYKDIYDMIDQVENEIFSELEDLLDLHTSEIVQRDIAAVLQEVFRFVGRNQNLCRVFLTRQSADRFFQRLNQLIYRKCLDEWKELYHTADREAPRYVLEFVVSGTVGLIRAWATNGFPEPPEDVAELANRLILYGVTPQWRTGE